MAGIHRIILPITPNDIEGYRLFFNLQNFEDYFLSFAIVCNYFKQHVGTFDNKIEI